jgi:hypothetical protein
LASTGAAPEFTKSAREKLIASKAPSKLVRNVFFVDVLDSTLALLLDFSEDLAREENGCSGHRTNFQPKSLSFRPTKSLD